MPSRIGDRKVLTAASIGNLIEVYDIIIYGYFATTLAGQFFPPGDPTAALLKTLALFAAGFVVRPLGAVVFGHVGDRFGRRTALAGSLLLMTLATAAFGLLPTYATVGSLAPALLLACRILQGLSLSAELPGSMLLVLEHAPAGRRGLISAINNASGALASMAAATVALGLATWLTPEQLAAWGWRAAFLLAAPAGLVGLYIRSRIPDSPAFTALDPAERAAPIRQTLATAKRGMLVLALWFGAQAIGAYILTGLMPSFLIRSIGLTPTGAFAANLVAVAVAAAFCIAGGHLLDRFPTRAVALTAMTGMAVAAVPGFLLIATYRTPAAAVAGQLLYSVFLGTAYVAGALLVLELFPPAIRFTAFAIPLSIGNSLLGSTAPYVSTWLTATLHNPVAPGFYLLAAAGAGTLAAAVGLRHRVPAPQPDRIDHQPGPLR